MQGILYELDRDIYIPFVEDTELNRVLGNGDYSFWVNGKIVKGLSGFFVARKVCIDNKEFEASKEYSEKIRNALAENDLK